MPLISCPECEREVSDKASTCPHCGGPLAASKDRQLEELQPRRVIKLVGIIVLLAVVLVLCWERIRGPQRELEEAREQEEKINERMMQEMD